MVKLAIITSHPIQYNAPLFSILARRGKYAVKVFYTLGRESSSFTDPGFKKTISWDIPLLEGYDYTFVNNISKNPSTSSFKGIINPTLIKEIQDFGATHLLVYGWNFYSHLKVLRHFHGKAKILFRGDSTLLDEKPGLRTITRRVLLKWVYRHIDYALYVGTNNKEYYLKHGVPTHKLVLAPHAVDNNRFNSYADEAKVKELQKELGIDQYKKVFLFAGKFEWKKNPALLVNAFNQINTNDSILLMVGSGSLENEIKELAADNVNIKFLPFQNQSVMPVVYRLGDILVLPSVTETWGLCINEAMACRLGVFASDKVGSAIDLIDEGVNGCIFQSNNDKDLLSKLEQFANKSKTELNRMGQNSFNKIKNWSFEKVCDSIDQTLFKI